MVTENGGIKSSAKYDEKLYAQLYKFSFICCILILVMGCLGIAASVATQILDKDANEIFLIVCFSILTAAGLFLIIMTRVNIKKSAKAGKSNVTEVYSDYFIAIEYQNGDKIGEAKVYFNTLYKVRECNEFFLAYVTRNAAYPIGKAGLTPAERIAVRKIMGLPQRSELTPQTVVPEEARKADERGLEVKGDINSADGRARVEDIDVFEDFPDKRGGEGENLNGKESE